MIEYACASPCLDGRRTAPFIACLVWWVAALVIGSAAARAGEAPGEQPAQTAESVAQAAEAVLNDAQDEVDLLRKLQEKGPREEAVEKGVAYLLSKQNPDGGFGEKHQTALTGLSVMALMAAGLTPDDPEHGAAVRRALQYVLSQMREDGYLGHRDHSRMYGHGICTLMLTEAAGMTKDEVLERRLVEACQRAVNVILAAQAVAKPAHQQGGWRYEPNSGDSDLSLTGWQTMSLRSAKNIGLNVPDAAIEAAVAFIRRVAHPSGGFGYQGPEDKAPLRGVGLLALPVCGVYEAKELEAATARMLQDPPKWGNGGFFYYRTYYAAVGMYQMGDEAWKRFYPLIDEALLKQQSADGSWPESPGNNEWPLGGEVYTTSMAVLALAVHQHLLPIYQR